MSISLILWPVSEIFHAYHWNYLVKQAYFISMLTFRSSFHTMAVKLQLTPVSMSAHFSFIFCPIFLVTTFLFGLTVPQHFIVSVCKSSNNFGDELSMYNLCPTLSVRLQLHQWLTLSKFHISYLFLNTKYIVRRPITLRNTQLVIFMPKLVCFFRIYCFEITLPSQSTIISNAKCSVGL
jgi:hypothetical protein